MTPPPPSPLTQLEAASGGPDAEARQALERLHRSLTALDAARVGELTEAPVDDDDDALLPQRMETLQGRVAAVESKLASLSDGAQEILSGSAGEWAQVQIQAAGEAAGCGQGTAGSGDSGAVG